MVVTNDEELGEKMRIQRVHGGKPKYYHKIIGGNFRIDALQAAVLNVKLPHLDNWSERRRKNAETYYKLFMDAGLSTETGKLEFDNDNKVLLPKAIYQQPATSNQQPVNYHIYNQFIIRVQKRDELKQFLLNEGVACEIYYPVPFHRQECFSNLKHEDGDFPNSNFAAETSLALPIYPELSNDQLEYVVNKISEFYGKN